MIKYFHELSKSEAKEVIKQGIKDHWTWADLGINYPQPVWCGYPEATAGIMGCNSLMESMVTGEDYCKGCDAYEPKIKETKEAVG